MYNTIVVPLDGSPLAEVALPFAEEVAGKTGSGMVLLSVLPSEETQEYEKYRRYSRKVVNVTRRHVEKYTMPSGSGAVDVGTATRVGDPADGILDYINKGMSNLIVMATHGRSGITRWSVGSVADKVVRSKSRQPIMLIRAKGDHPEIRAKRILKKVLVPLDGSSPSEAVIPYVTEMAQRLQMEVTLLQVLAKANNHLRDAEAYLQGICRQMSEKGISAGYEVMTGSPAEQIIDRADELAMDIVAMSTRGQAALKFWSMGSVAQKVLLGGNTPLMLIKV